MLSFPWMAPGGSFAINYAVCDVHHGLFSCLRFLEIDGWQAVIDASQLVQA